MAWFARFGTPILLPYGRKLLTLQDAADYIAALPTAESEAVDWQLAKEALRLAAERSGDLKLALVALLKALNQQPPPEPSEPRRPPPKLRIIH